MNNEKPINILIVDDHPLTRAGIYRAVEEDPTLHVCGEADTVDSAISVMERTHPDLVIVDISLKNGCGLDLVNILQNRAPKIPALVVSMHDEPVYIERAFRSGAKGYLLKRESTQQVNRAIRLILQGRTYVSESVAENFFGEFSRREEPVSIVPQEVLSKREYEVFCLLGQGLTRQEVADHLHLSVNTIESHVERMKPKLNITSSALLIHTAVKHTLKSS